VAAMGFAVGVAVVALVDGGGGGGDDGDDAAAAAPAVVAAAQAGAVNLSEAASRGSAPRPRVKQRC
jgi:hypothetical protein